MSCAERDSRISPPDVILLGGDVGEAPTVGNYLKEFATLIPCQVYFVLGNHGFYKWICPKENKRRHDASTLTAPARGYWWLAARLVEGLERAFARKGARLDSAFFAADDGD